MLDSPLSRAWAALTRFPALVLVPIAWEALVTALMMLFKSVPAPGEGRTVTVKFLLPQTLPSGSELLGTGVNLVPGGHLPLPALLVGLLMALAGSFITAGFLHLLVGALDGLSPTWDRFAEGVNRFGSRLLAWTLLTVAAITLAVVIGMGLGQAAVLLLLVGLVAVILFYLVPFLIVAEDLSVGEAISRAPARLLAELGPLFVVALVSVLISVVLSFLLSSLGLRTLWLASPLWAFFGTFVTLGVVAVLKPAELA
ncbi:MAG: hypothetical protein ACOY93_07400 [Bacillota bacterium]